MKNVTFCAVGAVVCLALLTSCSRSTHAAGPQPATPVEVRTPNVVERLESVTASGAVEGSDTADVAFLVSGRVYRVFVEEGQRVGKGQLLAELESTDYQNAFNIATAQKDAALAAERRADAGPRKQEREQARIELERWADEYRRMKFLVERKSLPPNDFQKIEAAYNAAKERYQMVEEGTRHEDKAAAVAQFHAASAQASEENKRLSDTRLVAPISGSISMRRIDPGQTVAAGAPVFTITELNPVKVRVGVPEADIAKVRPGAEAEITVPSLDGRPFKGKVSVIGVAAEPTSRTFTVKVLVANPGLTLLAGMVAEARIFGPATVKALTIPGEAIVPDPQGAPNVFVFNADRNRVYARRVSVGPPVGNEVEIRSGLTSTEQIVVSGQQKLREGSLVDIGGAK